MLAAAVAAAAGLAGVWWGRGVSLPPAGGPPTVSTVTASPSSLVQVVVHVAGWVADPGIVTLHPGARVGDAVAAAGGVRPGARLQALNLARTVDDGDQVVVPGPGEPENGESAVVEGGDDGLIHLNTATAAELERLPGVGPVLAERIVEQRDADGPFEQVEDLLEVAGIGEAKLGSIRELIAVP